MYFIFWYDYVTLPVYIAFCWLLLVRYFRRKHGYDKELFKYFKAGLILKMIGGIGIGLIYEHYYRGAYDGRWFFEGSKVLNAYFRDHPGQFFKVFFSSIKDFNETNLAGINMADYILYANESFFVAKVGSIFQFLSFGMFLPLSVFFLSVAYMALWNFFIFIQEEVRIPMKLAAYSTLFIPSVLVWDSSIFKDTITFTGLLWMFITAYYSFVKPRRLYANLIGFVVAAFFIGSVKMYIVAAFVPFFMLFIFNSYKNSIKNDAVRVLSTPFILVTALALIGVFLRNADELLGRYSVENALESATTTYNSITTYGGSAGSAYELNVDFSSPIGILAAIPQGINITLFRPYPWEYGKVFIFAASLESMAVLYFTVLIFFFKGGVGMSIRYIRKTPLLQFCLMFTFLFAFMTGIAAANFGTLVRYKIPCLPFYYLFLAYLYQAKTAELETRRIARQTRLSQDIPAHSF